MAGKIVAAFKAAQAEGKGVVTVDGRMIENLHVEQAERALAHGRGDQGTAGRLMSKAKTETGNFFEDFTVGQEIPPRHAAHDDRGRCGAEHRRSTARASPINSSDVFARALGLPARRSTTCWCSMS